MAKKEPVRKRTAEEKLNRKVKLVPEISATAKDTKSLKRKKKFNRGGFEVYRWAMNEYIFRGIAIETGRYELLPEMMDRFGMARKSAERVIQTVEGALLIRLPELAESAMAKNYLRLEAIISQAYEEKDKSTLIRAIELENKMFLNNSKKLEIETNPDGTQRFKITIGNEGEGEDNTTSEIAALADGCVQVDGEEA